MKPFGYHKKEKLKSRIQLEAIFSSGKSFNVFPIKVFYLEASLQQDVCLKAGVGVSSRHFKKAVDRNRIKRLLREVYRLEKPALLQVLNEKQKKATVFFLYLDKELPDYTVLKEKMKDALEKLKTKLVTGS